MLGWQHCIIMSASACASSLCRQPTSCQRPMVIAANGASGHSGWSIAGGGQCSTACTIEIVQCQTSCEGAAAQPAPVAAINAHHLLRVQPSRGLASDFKPANGNKRSRRSNLGCGIDHSRKSDIQTGFKTDLAAALLTSRKVRNCSHFSEATFPQLRRLRLRLQVLLGMPRAEICIQMKV